MSERTESGRPEISIIVPVYQVEKYLNECIDSILAQTFTDFELILVDDGSPDNCPALCDAAAKRDSRVRVIHKQNGGVSTARNAGLDAAQGNWIAFVDSDDTAAPEYLEKMHKAALETGADFAICSSQCIDETGKTLAGGEHRLLNEFLPQEEVLRRMVVSDFQVPWNKLYRRKLLENLRYPENKAFEDTCLMPVIYARAASACGVWDFLYNYRIVTGSAMHRKTTLKTLDWVEAWYRLFDVLYQNGIRDALCAAYRPILTAAHKFFSVTPRACISRWRAVRSYAKASFIRGLLRSSGVRCSQMSHTKKFVGGSGLRCIGLQLSGSMPQKG